MAVGVDVAMATLCAASAAMTPMALQSLAPGGYSQTLSARGAQIVLFWRSDCAPCQIELRAYRGLAHAAQPIPLTLVSLEAAEVSGQTLDRLGAPRDAAYAAVADPGEVLKAYGGEPPRLPLAVAIDAQGRVRARRHGLLGTQIIRQWVQKCLK